MKRILFVLILFVALAAGTGYAGLFDNVVKGFGQQQSNADNLDDGTIVSGLKEAFSVT